MNNQDYNIFEDVANNEDSITALFKNLLRFKPFRKSFLELLGCHFKAENIRFEDFETQFRTESDGIPDIVLKNDEIQFLFEVKVYVYRKLTENQPNGYINYLKTKVSANKKKGLFLIAPQSYLYKVDFEKGIEAETDIHYKFISWEKIINLIIEKEIDSLSPIFHEFTKFLKKWFKTIKFENLNVEIMYDSSIPKSIRTFIEIVDNVYNVLKSNKDLNLGYFSKKFTEEYGFYINQNSNYELFFGIWFEHWANTGKPITLCLRNNNSENTLLVPIFEKACSDNGLDFTADVLNWKCSFFQKDKIPKKVSEIETIATIITNVTQTLIKQNSI